jgi:signal peptidase I
MAVNKTVAQCLRIAAVSLLLTLMLAGFVVYSAPHFGWRVDGLRSGSMSPLLNQGDMVVTRPVEAQNVSLGDVIVFHSVDGPEYLMCHRVTEIETSPSLTFKTRGDANASADPFTVPAKNLVGELAFSIPFLGYPVLFLKTGAGLVFSLIIPGAVIIAICLKSLKTEMAKAAAKRIAGHGIEK